MITNYLLEKSRIVRPVRWSWAPHRTLPHLTSHHTTPHPIAHHAILLPPSSRVVGHFPIMPLSPTIAVLCHYHQQSPYYHPPGVIQGKGERNFHIFYQILTGAPAKVKRAFSLYGAENYSLTAGCVAVDGVNDAEEFNETIKAMKAVTIRSKEIEATLKIAGACVRAHARAHARVGARVGARARCVLCRAAWSRLQRHHLRLHPTRSAIVLHLSAVDFAADGGGNSEGSVLCDPTMLQTVCALGQVRVGWS